MTMVNTNPESVQRRRKLARQLTLKEEFDLAKLKYRHFSCLILHAGVDMEKIHHLTTSARIANMRLGKRPWDVKMFLDGMSALEKLDGLVKLGQIGQIINA